jgi:hypothetical protein
MRRSSPGSWADRAGFVRAREPSQRALVVVLTDFVEAESTSRGPSPCSGGASRAARGGARSIFTRLDRNAGADDAGASLYARLVLDDLLHERESALAALRRRGVETVDLQPQAITAAVLNRYLAIRRGPEL